MNVGSAIGFNAEYTCTAVYSDFSGSREMEISASKRLEVRGIRFHPSDAFLGAGTPVSFFCRGIGETQVSDT